MDKKRVHTAKNWTAAEAVKVIVEGKDFEAITNIMKRFPMFAYYAMQVNEAGVFLLSAFPEYFTARKINNYLSGNTDAVDGDAETASDDELDNDAPGEEETEEKPAKKEKRYKHVVEDNEDEEEEQPKKKLGRPAKSIKKPIKRVVEEDEDDDDDEDEEYVKPAKKSARGNKKSKPADDDDDFDFD